MQQEYEETGRILPTAVINLATSKDKIHILRGQITITEKVYDTEKKQPES